MAAVTDRRANGREAGGTSQPDNPRRPEGKPAKPDRTGEALKTRLSAQADAAFAASKGDPLKHLPTAYKRGMKSAEEVKAYNESIGLTPSVMAEARKQGQLDADAGAEFLLERPKVDPQEPPHQEVIDHEALRRAAAAGDLEALAAVDKRLAGLIASDPKLQALVKDGDFTHPDHAAALELYRSSFMTLTAGRDTQREAFQAVMRDDAEALKLLLDKGVRTSLRNSGGLTLLALARERKKEACEEVLIEAGAED